MGGAGALGGSLRAAGRGRSGAGAPERQLRRSPRGRGSLLLSPRVTLPPRHSGERCEHRGADQMRVGSGGGATHRGGCTGRQARGGSRVAPGLRFVRRGCGASARRVARLNVELSVRCCRYVCSNAMRIRRKSSPCCQPGGKMDFFQHPGGDRGVCIPSQRIPFIAELTGLSRACKKSRLQKQRKCTRFAPAAPHRGVRTIFVPLDFVASIGNEVMALSAGTERLGAGTNSNSFNLRVFSLGPGGTSSKQATHHCSDRKNVDARGGAGHSIGRGTQQLFGRKDRRGDEQRGRSRTADGRPSRRCGGDTKGLEARKLVAGRPWQSRTGQTRGTALCAATRSMLPTRASSHAHAASSSVPGVGTTVRPSSPPNIAGCHGSSCNASSRVH